jgi:tRNA(Ile)-lysidine synthase
MVLLDLFARLQSEYVWDLGVAHLNHELRGRESDDDEAFVRSQSEQRRIPFYGERASASRFAGEKKMSVEEAGRELRRDFFTRLRQSIGFQKIATAHHADDNAETLVFNFVRGAGIEGHSGIPVRNRELSIIRPLLFATRADIAAYAQDTGLPFREDSSNAGNDYTRNYLRHTVLPMLRENVNPNLTATLLRSAEIFDGLDDYLEDETRRLLPEIILERNGAEIVMDLEALLSRPLFLQEYLLLHIARAFTGAPVTFGTIQSVLSITGAESGASSEIGGGCRVARDRGRLIFRRPAGSGERRFRYEIETEKRYAFEEFEFASSLLSGRQDLPGGGGGGKNVEFIDASRVSGPLVLRPWQRGDAFVPLGMNGLKKLSDYFIDAKVPVFEKGKIPLLVSGTEIIWVCGRRLDDRWKITPATSRILKLEYSPRTSYATE